MHEDEKKAKDFERLEFLEEALGIKILSYGLAPNPSGYCFEILDEEKWSSSEKKYKDEFNFLCYNADRGYL